MQIQCKLPEDAKNIISLVRKFDALTRFSFECATCPYKLLSVYRSSAYKCIQSISISQSACLKRRYASNNVDLDPLFI